jgi:cellulose synthase/poly-beta-1,6-N-acetylglucosamine synthase-like glycosyltransferase
MRPAGKYVAVLDADDRMLPGRLSKQVAWMEARPEVVACGAWGHPAGRFRPRHPDARG